MSQGDPEISINLEGPTSPGFTPQYASSSHTEERTGRDIVSKLDQIVRALEKGQGQSTTRGSTGSDPAITSAQPRDHLGRFMSSRPAPSTAIPEDAPAEHKWASQPRDERGRFLPTRTRLASLEEEAHRIASIPTHDEVEEVLAGLRRSRRGGGKSVAPPPVEDAIDDEDDFDVDRFGIGGRGSRRGGGGGGGRSPVGPPSGGPGPAPGTGGNAGGGGGGAGTAALAAGAGRFFTGGGAGPLAGALAGGATGAFGLLGGLAVGAVAGAAIYETKPYVEAFFAERAQFRDEYVQGRVMRARGNAIMGRGLPSGTMLGQGSLDVSNSISGETRSGLPGSARKIINPNDPLNFAEDMVDQYYGEISAPGMNAEEREKLDRASAAKLKMSYEEFIRRREIRRGGAAGGGGDAQQQYQKQFNPLDPEGDMGPDNLYADGLFRPEDMQYGMPLAPLVATLRRDGLTSGPPKLGKKWLDYHRPRTQEELDHPGVEERDKRMFNTPAVGAGQIEAKFEEFEKWMLDFKPVGDREISGDAIVYQMVASPWGGMSA